MYAERPEAGQLGVRDWQSRDGRGSARRGRVYDELVGDADLLEGLFSGRVSQRHAADILGTSQVEVTRALAAIKEDIDRRRSMEAHVVPEEATASLRDFAAFRARYFQVPNVKGHVLKGSAYRTPAFQAKWAAAIEEAIESGTKLQVLAPPRHGKQIAHSCPVLTPQGWRTHGDLGVGDEVYAPDGSITRVIGLSRERPCDLDIEFADGEVITTHAEHRWRVYDRSQRAYRTMETQELAERPHMGRLCNGEPRARFLLDYTEPLRGREADLPLDPYVLGVWIGDGQMDGGTICKSEDDLAEILVECKARGWEHSSSWVHKTTGVHYAYFRGLTGMLRRAGVLGDKHIPDAYFTGSLEQRRDLLRGLVDTDGHVEPGGRVRVVTIFPRLAEGIARLVSTLGYRPTITMREAALSSSGIQGRHDVLTVQWTPHDGERQAYLTRKDTRRDTVRRRRAVVDIRPAANPEMGRCIAVDHPSHLYLVGARLVPTHNTEMLGQFGIQQILKRPNIRIMWVGGNEDIAKLSLAAVRDHLEHNEKLIEDFLGPSGTFKPPSRSGVPWRDDSLTVTTRTVRGIRSPTLVAIGKGGKILSRDADLVIVDDIIDHQSTRQPATRKADDEWFRTQLMSRLEPHTAVVVIGSRQHPQDLYRTNLGKEGWTHIIETAHDRVRCTGDPHVDCVLFPELRPYVWLMEQADELGDKFEMVYLNKPRAEGAAIFDEQQVKNCRNTARVLGMKNLPPEVAKRCRLVAGMDPAASGYQASVLWAYDPVTRKRWLVDLRNDLAGGIQGARDVVREWYELYRCTLWVVEANSQQSVWLQDDELRSYCAQFGIVTKPHYTTATNKWDEHHGVSTQAGLFRERLIDLPYGDPETRKRVDVYVEQLLDWTGEPKQHWRRRSDLVMAGWFPEPMIRSWAMASNRKARADYDETDYLDEWMEVA